MNEDDFKHPLSRVLPSRPQGPMRVPARVLGWFSIAVGLAELAMPRKVARLAGAANVPLLTRVHGLREVGTGIGILTSRDPAPWIWGRLAGDAIDLATVGAGLVPQRRPVRTLASVSLLLGLAWLDLTVAQAAPVAKNSSGAARRDYSDRSGFPRPAEEMRGIAAKPIPAVPSAGNAARRQDAPVGSLVGAVAGTVS